MSRLLLVTALCLLAAPGCVLGKEQDPGCRVDSECDHGFVCRAGACLRYSTEDVVQAVRARDAALTRVAHLEAVIRSALDVANGRWSEWGERAVDVPEILDAALTSAEGKP